MTVTAASQPGDSVTVEGRKAKVVTRRMFGTVLVIQAATPSTLRREGSLHTYCFTG